MDDLVIRPYVPDDDAALRALPLESGLPEDDVWGRVAEVGGNVAGYSRVDHWDEADGTRLYLLSGGVAPAFRRRGIGRSLLAHQEAQAVAHWHDDPGSGPALLGGNADENQPETRALLLATGYRVRFTVVDMARDTAGTTDGDLPPGLILCPVREHDHPRIHRTLRACFADSTNGQQLPAYADYLSDVRDVELWLIAWDGDEVAAAVVNERRADGSADTPWVAVLPAWRRRGVARALVQRSLRLLADQGVRLATIRTVVENPNHTVALYEQAGYRVTARHPRYAKPLDQAAAVRR